MPIPLSKLQSLAGKNATSPKGQALLSKARTELTDPKSAKTLAQKLKDKVQSAAKDPKIRNEAKKIVKKAVGDAAFSMAFRKIVEEKNLTQEQAAAVVGCSRQEIGRWVHGSSQPKEYGRAAVLALVASAGLGTKLLSKTAAVAESAAGKVASKAAKVRDSLKKFREQRK